MQTRCRRAWQNDSPVSRHPIIPMHQWRVRDLVARFKGDRYLRRVESEPGDVSSPSPERLWRSVLRRQRSELAMVATYPDDASLN